jgi:chromosome segregation ATPase
MEGLKEETTNNSSLNEGCIKQRDEAVLNYHEADRAKNEFENQLIWATDSHSQQMRALKSEISDLQDFKTNQDEDILAFKERIINLEVQLNECKDELVDS